MADTLAGVTELLRRAPEAKVGVMGFCFGGGMSWSLVASGDPRLAAAVPFYGTIPEGAVFAGSKAAVLGVYAELDARVNATRDAATAALVAAGLTHEIKTYPGVDHAFFNDTGPRYNAAAAAEAYTAVLAWFGRHLGRGPAGHELTPVATGLVLGAVTVTVVVTLYALVRLRAALDGVELTLRVIVHRVADGVPGRPLRARARPTPSPATSSTVRAALARLDALKGAGTLARFLFPVVEFGPPPPPEGEATSRGQCQDRSGGERLGSGQTAPPPPSEVATRTPHRRCRRDARCRRPGRCPDRPR